MSDGILIKFVKDHEVQNAHRGTDRATIYPEGLRKSFPAASARHFLKRGVAVLAGPSKAAAKRAPRKKPAAKADAKKA